MANVNLKSVQFPGLPDKYVVPQVDATLTQPGRPADAKKTGDEIAAINTALSSKANASDLTAETTAREAADEALTEAIANKASADGSYEGMTVGSSEQLLSDSYTEDKVPYLFRASGGNGADREYDEIVGGTVAWNQLGELSEETTHEFAEGDSYYGLLNILSKRVVLRANHKYVLAINASRVISSNNTFSLSVISSNTGVGIAWQNGTPDGWRETVVNCSNENFGTILQYSNYAGKRGFNAGDSITVKQIMIFDLTALFGTTIADYIYSLETATAGAGVAFFRKLFPKEYYPYDAGTLKSVEGVSAHEMVGFNQWDEVWELGNLQTNGTKGGSTDRIRSKNYIPILPNTAYYIEWPSSNTFVRRCFYDENKAFISYFDIDTKAPFTTPSNAHYMLFNLSNYYGTTYDHDICINLSDPSRNGEYEPYVKHTYPLDDSLTLRGIPKLDASNNLYYDGDTYEADGTVTRRYGVVDLGTLTWTYATTYEHPLFYADIVGKKVNNNIVCNKYINRGLITNPNVFGAIADKIIGSSSSSPRVFIRDDSYTDAATFKTAMSGVMLVYELATSTTETADPYEALQIVDPYGTEEYVTTGIVPVGHDTKYPDNLKAKIEGLPWNFATLIAPTEATYKATQNYTTGALFIVANILYKATANIANGGTITPGTNCTATTLAEVISALA